METQQPGADVIVKKKAAHHTGVEFLCNTKNKTQLIRVLSQYLNEDIHTIINCEDAADTHIVHANLYFACEKNLTIFADETGIVVYTTFVLLEQWDGEHLHENRQKEEWNFKSWWILKML